MYLKEKLVFEGLMLIWVAMMAVGIFCLLGRIFQGIVPITNVL